MDSRPHFTVNRRLVILLPKQPFLDWLLATDEDTSATLTLLDLRRDPEVYLVPEKAGELPEDVEKWVYKRWRGLFEHLLHSWYTDESAWPQDRDLKLFKHWVEVQCFTFVWDLAGDQPIEIEDWDEYD
jgi:hypothetical protein